MDQSRYFREILKALSSHPFYSAYVHLPDKDAHTPPEIESNPKLFPYFENVRGALDGVHISCCPSLAERGLARNRKGEITQNCLAVCGFDFKFYYILSGWDGCATDTTVYYDARISSFPIPHGIQYLADGGYGLCEELLIPYRKVQYHLAEWGRADVR